MASHKVQVSPPPCNQTIPPQPPTSGLVRSLRNRPRSAKTKAPTRSKYFECTEEDEPTRDYSTQDEDDTGPEKVGDEMHMEVSGDERGEGKASMRSKTRGNKRRPGIALQRAGKQRKTAKSTVGQVLGVSPTSDSEGPDVEGGNEYMIHPNTMAFLKGKKFIEC